MKSINDKRPFTVATLCLCCLLPRMPHLYILSINNQLFYVQLKCRDSILAYSYEIKQSYVASLWK